MLAALGNGGTGGTWDSLLDKVCARRTWAVAWKRGAAKQGAAGVDGISLARFKARASHSCAELERDLREGRYQPLPARRVHISTGQGKTPPWGSSAVQDQIVQRAVKMVLAPSFDRDFRPCNDGFRPGQGCKDALREVDRWLKAGYTWVVEVDLATYCDSIPKAPLWARVADKGSDGTLLELVQRFLDQEILAGMHQGSPLAGVPQGAGLSPLLSKLSLHPLDRVVSHAGHVIVRSCDDLVLLCRTQADAEAAWALVPTWTAQHGLRLHPEKTRRVDGSQGGNGFDFLGYRFAGGRRDVRPKSLQGLRDKIRQHTGRTRSGSLAQSIAELHPLLRGWFGDFKHARCTTLRDIEGVVRRRLRALLRKREKRPGFGRTSKDHQRWPNAFCAAQGLFTLHEAYGRASQSR
jgi:RNA-directed DNA polymerase